MPDIVALAETNLKKAHAVIAESGVVAAWESIGATVNLVGSVKMGLLMKHRDIDFHIYSSPLEVSASFAAMARLAANPAITRVEYGNLMDTEEQCLEWHAWYRDGNGDSWQLDMIHILRGSRYDGHMEKVAAGVVRALTPEVRKTILQLKYEAPDEKKVSGIVYYQAVIRDGVKTYAEFEQWLREQSTDGVMQWMPE